MDVVLVPCWQRPELLKETCRRLAAADRAEEHLFIFRVDRRPHPHLHQVLQGFPHPHDAIQIERHPYRGNSYNVLMGYKAVAPHLAVGDLCYLVEEDIFVCHDFFTWHRAIHRQCSATIASACADQNLPPRLQDLPQRPEAYYTRHKFQSLGISLKAWVIQEIAQHAVTGYFADPTGYLLRQFPKSILGPWYTEQDGLIDRMIEQDRWPIAYPFCPRAYHAGEVGYHAGHAHTIRPVSEVGWGPVEPERVDLEVRP